LNAWQLPFEKKCALIPKYLNLYLDRRRGLRRGYGC
jgi:hypothetical protein